MGSATDTPGIGRREFLVLSSTCALAAAAMGPKVFAGETAAPKRLAVGYAPPDESTSLVAASSIPAGDGRFIRRGARISVSGASGFSSDPRSRRAVDLLVDYSYWDGAARKAAPFRAWACSRTTGCQGNPVKFTVPVDEVQKISFRVGVERGLDGAAARGRRDTDGPPAITDDALPVTLSMLSDSSSLKLVRGFYVIVPLFDDDAEPRWSAYTLQQREGRWALQDREGNVAPFEHFVLRIDYA
ncbi:MAG TPA: hypothetical protein VEO74_11310 [Thermoanaerobaculia bacterium]|nr:hypothetical protein [Thermoanaerobaculia bacterium]